MKKIKLSIYVKLFLAFIIVLIPIYTTSLLINKQSADVVSRELSNSMISKVDFFMNQLEIEFDRVIDMEQGFFEDDDLNALSIGSVFMSDLVKVEHIKRIQKRLNLLSHSSSYISQTNAVIPNMNRIIYSNDSFGEIHQDDLDAMLAFVRHQNTIISLEDRLYISKPFPDSVFLQEDRLPLYIITVELSKDKLRQVIDSFSEEGQGGAILVGTRYNWVLASDSAIEESEGILDHYRQIRNDSLEELTPASIRLNDQDYLLTHITSEFLGATLIMYVPEKAVLGPLEKISIWFWLLSGLSLIIVAGFSRIIFLLIHRPLKTLISAFKKMESGNLNVVVKRSSADEFSYLYDRFNLMAEKMNVLVHEVYEQRYLHNLAELKQLQAQINPHFLYNSLFILHRMAINEDYDGVTGFTKYLGNFYRFITRSGSDAISLKSEIEFVRTYIEIQKVRFNNRIAAEIEDLPETYGDILVPRLIVQPLVENAYNHGLENKLSEGLIRVSFGDRKDEFVVAVEDNGNMLTDEQLARLQSALKQPLSENAETTGMINIHRRIRMKYGLEWGLECSRSDMGGLKAEVHIPITEG